MCGSQGFLKDFFKIQAQNGAIVNHFRPASCKSLCHFQKLLLLLKIKAARYIWGYKTADQLTTYRLNVFALFLKCGKHFVVVCRKGNKCLDTRHDNKSTTTASTTNGNCLNMELRTQARRWASASTWKRPQQPRTVSARYTVCPERRHFLSRPDTQIPQSSRKQINYQQ